MLSRNFVKIFCDFEMVLLATVINGITFMFIFHLRCVYIVKFFYILKSFIIIVISDVK